MERERGKGKMKMGKGKREKGKQKEKGLMLFFILSLISDQWKIKNVHTKPTKNLGQIAYFLQSVFHHVTTS